MKCIEIGGMHGMGDNLHIRAIVRQLKPSYEKIFIKTSWVSIYHDFIAQGGVYVIHKPTNLRTQTKNAKREAHLFSQEVPPLGTERIQIKYSGASVLQTGSVPAAMFQTMGGRFGLNSNGIDFRLPVPDIWLAKADLLIERWHPKKPILIYRPLVVRTEVGRGNLLTGLNGRNPEPGAYARVLRAIRERFFVISIADLVPGVEWTISEPIDADLEFYHGELDFETIAAIMRRSALVYASPGFAVPLAQAVETPVICMFGGYEDSRSFSAGAKFTPYLGLDVINPCRCFNFAHRCDKSIDVEVSIQKVLGFLDDIAGRPPRSIASVAGDTKVHAAQIYESGGNRSSLGTS